MLDVYVRVAPAADGAPVAEVVRWSAEGHDPAAPRHQVVTLHGAATVEHLAWAVAAATRGSVDERPWTIHADGSAVAEGEALSAAQVRADAAVLLAGHEAPLRRAMAEVMRQGTITGPHGRGIRLPIDFSLDATPDDDALLASVREAYGADAEEPSGEEELAA